MWLLPPSTPLESPYIVSGRPVVSSLPISWPHPSPSISSLPFAQPHTFPTQLSYNPSTILPYFSLPYPTLLTLNLHGTVFPVQYLSVSLVVILWEYMKRLSPSDLVLVSAPASLVWGTQFNFERS
jgi:hypothetical protein